MSDWDDADFVAGGEGYYRVYYGNPDALDGPYSTIRELAEQNRLQNYPIEGYIVFFAGRAKNFGNVVSNVPSLNPDDLWHPLHEGQK